MELPGADHKRVLASLLPAMLEALPKGAELEGVGHRVVHGGPEFSSALRIDAQVEKTIDELSPLAPLHNPINLAGIRAAKELLPRLPHIAVFDTAFHSRMPRRSRSYAIDAAVAEKHQVRRYGFHTRALLPTGRRI